MHARLSQGLSSPISAVCSRAHYEISMVEGALISPFSEYASVFNGSVHCHCRSSDWTGIICICLCFLALPRYVAEIVRATAVQGVTHLLSNWTSICVRVQVGFWAKVFACVCVVFFVRNLYHSICEPTLRRDTFPCCLLRCLAGPRERWAEAKPAAICGNVSTGTDLYRVWLISAFRRLIPMSIFRLGLLCWHALYLSLTIF